MGPGEVLIFAVLVIGTGYWVVEFAQRIYRSIAPSLSGGAAEIHRLAGGDRAPGDMVPLDEVPEKLASLAWLALEGQGEEIMSELPSLDGPWEAEYLALEFAALQMGLAENVLLQPHMSEIWKEAVVCALDGYESLEGRYHSRTLTDEAKTDWADVIRQRGIVYVTEISRWSGDSDWPAFGLDGGLEERQRLALVIMESSLRYKRFFQEGLGY